MSRSLSFDAHLDCAYEQALDKVAAALKEEGFGILTRIDVSATMKEKLGADFRPYAILGACNPPLAYKVLSHRPEAGLLLPCNVTVEAQGDGRSLVRIGDPEVMLATGGLDEDTELREVAAEVQARLKRVAAALGASG
jgi:uncharacterized protein (DUF302 family)